MKLIPSAFQQHYDSDTTSLAWCLYIEGLLSDNSGSGGPRDTGIARFTSCDHDLAIPTFNLLDSFTGAAGPLVDHIPEQTQPDFAWLIDADNPAFACQIDGSGAVVPFNDTDSSYNRSSSLYVLPGYTEIAIGMKVNFADTGLAGQSAFVQYGAEFVDNQSNPAISIVFYTDVDSGDLAFQVISNSLTSPDTYNVTGTGEHVASVVVTDQGFVATIDGIEQSFVQVADPDEPTDNLLVGLNTLSLQAQDSGCGVTITEVSIATNHVLDGTYESAQGLQSSQIVSTSGLAVDNCELTVFDDETFLLPEDVITGWWSAAKFTLFEVNWQSPSLGINILKCGRLGELRRKRGLYTVELRSLKQALQQSIGEQTSINCRAELGDRRCGFDLSTVTDDDQEVTSVVNNREFAFTSARADDFFGRGFLRWKTGANAGLRMPIRESVLSGDMSIKLFSEMYHDIEVGDIFTVTAGCRQRWEEDCKTKFDNLLNFQGEKDLPGMDRMTKPP